jgi:hypothetical protein
MVGPLKVLARVYVKCSINDKTGEIDYSTTHDVAQYNAIERLAAKAQVLALPFKASARSAATIGATTR